MSATVRNGLTRTGVVVAGLVLSAGATREAARRQVARRRPRIDPASGVDELFPATIGGMEQWFHARGLDRRNPVLLYLHGGPGTPMMPFSPIFQGEMERDFTVVHWDQRAAGKTFVRNPGADHTSVTFDRMVQDAAEVLDLLKARYGVERVTVLGHSWGSMLGLALLRERPEDVAAYVGTGQVVDISRNNAVAYEATLTEARRRGDSKAIATLEGLQPYPDPADGEVGPKLDVLQGIQRVYGFAESRRWRRLFTPYLLSHALRSPEYSLREVAYFLKEGRSITPTLYDDLGEFTAARYGTDFPMPMFLLLGRHDWQTPSTIAVEWFETVSAPRKEVVWFEQSAHSPVTDEPLRFAQALRSLVRPAVTTPAGA
jgi:pimeloyl-ACP methyl ester carboxylesterase